MEVTIVRGHADRIWSVRPGAVTWRSIEDETVLLDTTDAMYLVLNHTASVMWSALEGGATTEELSQLLVDRYSIDQPLAAADAAAFIDSCQRRGWVD